MLVHRQQPEGDGAPEKSRPAWLFIQAVLPTQGFGNGVGTRSREDRYPQEAGADDTDRELAPRNPKRSPSQRMVGRAALDAVLTLGP
jgi:hypothetical protein